MMLFYQQERVIQGFICYGRIKTYLPHMKAGATYRLNKFFGSKCKTIYRVAEPSVTISFSWNYVLSVLEDSSIRFPEDRFRIHGFREFEAASDLRGDLYGKFSPHYTPSLDPVLKLYLWDNAAFEFCEKFKAYGGTARVILVITLNPKRFGGLLNSNLDVASGVNADVVTKPETATLGELFSYMNQASAKVAWFECTTTIDDVVHCSGRYYIGCGVCHTKATKGPTTLMCKKCGKSEIVGVAQYMSKLSVYDHNEQAVFVVLGDAGEELTGKKAAELVERYFQNVLMYGRPMIVWERIIVLVPQAMIDTIGQTRKFIVKVSNHNLTAKPQTLTVTKMLPLEAPEPEGNLGENVGEEADNEREDYADESVKRGVDGIESEGVKRAKCG
ncbi:unnamed protein product [Brassica napus]|uniref:(rape) hypothetical protein n=1 Tax=Brassica napus TaxID=3708 RepID=A0A816JIH5_BRANA|nr:unnamed protein product [Brassica napus]